MDWIRKIGSHWSIGVCSILGLLLGVPGILENIERIVGDMSPMLSGVIIGASSIGLIFWVWAKIYTHRITFFKLFRESEIIQAVGIFILIILILTLFLKMLESSGNVSEFIWINPDLTAKEQQKLKSECEMKVVEIFGNSLAGLTKQKKYMDNCLITKGFIRERVEPTEAR